MSLVHTLSVICYVIFDHEFLTEVLKDKDHIMFKHICLLRNFCWRALARQLPILYNREKKAKSVGCKIEDMRSRLRCYIRSFQGAACECTWKY